MTPPIADENVPHEAAHAKATDAQMRRTSTQLHIPNAVVAAAAPTQGEFNAVVAKLNLVLGVLRDAELIPSS